MAAEARMAASKSEREQELYAWFSEAVRQERESQKMYKTAIDLIEDAALQTAFETILKEEERHEMWLLDLYTQYRESLGLNESGE